ncbi:MAG TPA: phytoene/squalene synthase family protein [Candidatus Sulfotelmatobacter sp.]|jgi:phytoene synthase|nr:phytoene/squalene synthase family protein [Candidatus Sulfotelmatobacter sp.]
MPSPADLSLCAQEVRRHDRDRFVLSLFAPPQEREALLALYAFNAEIARVRELVTEPMLGRIRLQWWRDMIGELFAGASGAEHPTAAELGRVIRAYGLSRDPFEQLLNARELDMEPAPPADLAALEDYAAGTAASLQVLTLEILGVGDHNAARAAARHVGLAWALTGILRAFPYHALAGRILLPFDLLDEAGIDVGDILAGKPPREALARVARRLSAHARDHLAQARGFRRSMPKQAIPALLPASLAESYLKRLEAKDHDLTDQAWSRINPRPLLLAWRGMLRRY